MGDIFLKLLNMSITAGWLILAVLSVRFLFRKMPKWICCLLWGVVAIRLLVPFSIESAFSLQLSAEPIQYRTVAEGENQAYVPSIDSSLSFVENRVNPALRDSFAYEESESAAPLQIVTGVAGNIWFFGMLLLIVFALMSTIRLYFQVRESVRYKDNAYICDAVSTPFILGVFRPRIYLPSALSEEEMAYILAHEKAHLKRGDHLWKPIGYLILCVYWFQPLCWIAYMMLCKDIELACDEKVIRDMSFDDKKEYSRVLLSCATQRHFVISCPLAFGEVGVKERVKSVLNYRKPAFWIVILAVISCAVIAACFLTDPITSVDEQTGSSEESVGEQMSSLEESIDEQLSSLGGSTKEDAVSEHQTTTEENEVLDETGVFDELSRVVGTVGLENAYPWSNTVDLKQNADTLIKMAGDESGRYEIYGIMSKKYGTYGLLLNDWIGGDENWNFAFVPWYYSGTPTDEPVLSLDENGTYMFSYVYAYEDGVPMWQENVLDCGYDTGHMELTTKEEYDTRFEEIKEASGKKHDEEFYDMVRESCYGSGMYFMSMYIKMFRERDAAGIAVLSGKEYSEDEQEFLDRTENAWMTGATAEFCGEKSNGEFTMKIMSGDRTMSRYVDVKIKNDTSGKSYYVAEPSREVMAYIEKLDAFVSFDVVEWVTVPGERADELGITEEDAPSGFYVYNETERYEDLPVADTCSCKYLDWTANYEQIEVTSKEMIRILEERKGTKIPYRFVIANDQVVEIAEQYVP